MAERRHTVGSLAQVLRDAGLLLEVRGAEDSAVSGPVITGVCQDSRIATAGDLFLAWKGASADGHDFVSAASDRGAVAALVERSLDLPIPQLVVRDGRRAAALLAMEVVGRGSEGLLLVAVTGTNGKTTTTFLIRHLLSSVWPSAALGTLGVVGPDGVRREGAGLTTPGPVEIATRIRSLAEEGTRTLAMEASSHALDQHRLDGLRFDIGVFTNLSQDHLDYHGGLEAYFAAKASLVELLGPEGVVVVNADDPAWGRLELSGHRCTTYGIEGEADVRAEGVTSTAAGSTFELVVDGAKRSAELPLPGLFNVENALAAVAVAWTAGVPLEEIVRSLASAPQVPGRLERVVEAPFTVLIDFAHTPDALTRVLAAIRPLTAGRLIVVFGAGGDRDRTKRRGMAEAVARFADIIVLTSDNPRTEDPEQILRDLAEGLEGVSFITIADRRRAIARALDDARDGDTVLLAGKGHETYQIVGREKIPFDERVIVRAHLGHPNAA